MALEGSWEGIDDPATAHGATVVDSAGGLNGTHGNKNRDERFVLPDGRPMTAAGHQFVTDFFLAADGLDG